MILRLLKQTDFQKQFFFSHFSCKFCSISFFLLKNVFVPFCMLLFLFFINVFITGFYFLYFFLKIPLTFSIKISAKNAKSNYEISKNGREPRFGTVVRGVLSKHFWGMSFSMSWTSTLMWHLYLNHVVEQTALFCL